MPALMRRFNQKAIILGPVPPAQTVGVLQPDGDYTHVPWAGFINADAARRSKAAKSVRLEIDAYQHGGGSDDWVKVPEGRHILGCDMGSCVYAVLYSGAPRVV